MRVSPYTYGSAVAACAVLWLIAPPAGFIMSTVLAATLLEELSTARPRRWEKDETGLETLRDD